MRFTLKKIPPDSWGIWDNEKFEFGIIGSGIYKFPYYKKDICEDWVRVFNENDSRYKKEGKRFLPEGNKGKWE